MLNIVQESPYQGVQFSSHVVLLKVAHGIDVFIEKVIVSQSGSCPVGVNVYGSHSFHEVKGVHEIVGAQFTFITVIIKLSSLEVSIQSLTMIVMFSYDFHQSLDQGVQLSVHVFGSRVSQFGMFSHVNIRVSQSGSCAVGVNV